MSKNDIFSIIFQYPLNQAHAPDFLARSVSAPHGENPSFHPPAAEGHRLKGAVPRHPPRRQHTLPAIIDDASVDPIAETAKRAITTKILLRTIFDMEIYPRCL
jgi:hypothetical protein